MARVSPLAELALRVSNSKKENFTKDEIYNLIHDVIPYEMDSFNEAFESKDESYFGMFTKEVYV
jgi:hypothetical protein